MTYEPAVIVAKPIPIDHISLAGIYDLGRIGEKIVDPRSVKILGALTSEQDYK
jgi:hypothetical protein